jgi:hypothetical protein
MSRQVGVAQAASAVSLHHTQAVIDFVRAKGAKQEAGLISESSKGIA